MAVLVSDSFTRANSTTTMGSTMVGNKPWLKAGTQTWGITSNQAYPISTSWDNPVYVDAGVSDNIDYSVKAVVWNSQAQIMWRITSGQNYHVIQGSYVYISRNGTFEQLGSGLNITNGSVVKIQLRGSSVSIFINGVLAFSYTDSTWLTGTGFGFSGNSTSLRFDDFLIETPDGTGGGGTATVYAKEDFLDTTYTFPMTNGSPGWTRNSGTAMNGKTGYIQSNSIGHNATATVSFAVVVPTGATGAYLEIDWAVDSEEDFDFLEIYIDGTRLGRYSGKLNAMFTSGALQVGSHTVQFRYTKDGSTIGGTDRAQVTEIRLFAITSKPFVKIGALKISQGDLIPIYDITDHEEEKLRVMTTDGKGFMRLVPVNDANASRIRVRIGSTNYALMK